MGPQPQDPFIRFWEKVKVSEEGCWLWTASLTRNGYAQFFIGNPWRPVGAHRWIWEHFNGPVPDGLEIDHLCRVRHCVNPAHLEPVSRRENVLRGISPVAKQMKQVVCKNGHPFDRIGRFSGGGSYRWCSICKAEAHRIRYDPERRRERYLTLGK